MFSVGAGRGELELELVRDLGLRLGYIEPDAEAIRQFESSLRESGLESSILDRHHGRFQTFESNQRYDLGLFIFSWLPKGREIQWLKKAMSLLTPA